MDLRPMLTNLARDLSSLNQNEPTVVTYEEGSLVYRQLDKVIILDYLNPYFFPKKGFKIGVLTQSGLNDLKYNLQNILQSTELESGSIILSLSKLSLEFYKYFGKELGGPQRYKSLVLVNIINGLVAKFYCSIYNNNTRIILKSIIKSKKGSSH